MKHYEISGILDKLRIQADDEKQAVYVYRSLSTHCYNAGLKGTAMLLRNIADDENKHHINILDQIQRIQSSLDRRIEANGG